MDAVESVMLSIRGFDFTNDYEALMWLENGIHGGNVSVEELRERDASRVPGLAWGRLVAVWDWQIVGAIEAQQKPDPFQGRSEVRVGVRPDHRGLGIGTALVTALETALRDAGGDTMLAFTDELEMGYNHFLWRVGFAESARGYPQWLALPGYDLERFSVNWDAIREAGLEFRSLSEVRFEWDCAQKLYDLYCTVERDVPRVDDWYIPKPFDEFCADIFDSPSSLPDGVMLAVRVHDWGMEYVGCNILYLDSGGRVLHNGLTGVRREARGLGLALALKLKGIEFARNNGFDGIKSYNASTNDAILKLNTKLGFQRQSAILEWRKRI
ncbi:MAG: GNAT family N-acetyltransferase [Pleurocapsa sp. SU_196_0]|nr:GNAT family N-acetyltransferase [Pleurocapsa sp. SU_196_0]